MQKGYYEVQYLDETCSDGCGDAEVVFVRNGEETTICTAPDEHATMIASALNALINQDEE